MSVTTQQIKVYHAGNSMFIQLLPGRLLPAPIFSHTGPPATHCWDLTIHHCPSRRVKVGCKKRGLASCRTMYRSPEALLPPCSITLTHTSFLSPLPSHLSSHCTHSLWSTWTSAPHLHNELRHIA